jgi:hypothetical protein
MSMTDIEIQLRVKLGDSGGHSYKIKFQSLKISHLISVYWNTLNIPVDIRVP